MINRDSKAMQEFLPTFDFDSLKSKGKKKGSSSGGGSSSSSSGNKSSDKIKVGFMYKPMGQTTAIFEHLKKPTKKLYTLKECREVVWAYVTDLELPVKKNRVTLSPELISLFPKNARPDEWTTRPKLFDAFVGRLQTHTVIQLPGKPAFVRKGAMPQVSIVAETRGGHKLVTRLSGLEPWNIDPKELAPLAQKKFACSVSVADLTGKNAKGKELTAQGNMIYQFRELLQDLFGLTDKMFDIEDKTVKKKKGGNGGGGKKKGKK
eukprot:TRINITY_DN5358_c0_g1_i9.p1 TRINITY_DN5358_c0_g1~~TRINITY_DN5358_c0_g1_i9.p1  ORF type:complete len:263 (-),score=100.87 TRINITY_DN5358_c0_g1_i9:549-1337(-)